MYSLLDKKDLYRKNGIGQFAYIAVSFAVSFLFCGFSVNGGLSPFGVSFALCLPYELLCAGFPGCAFGYATSLGTADALRYWGALTLGGTLRVIIHRRVGEKRAAELSPLFSAVGVFLSGIVLAVLRGFSAEGLILLAGEAAVCAGSCFFFGRTAVLLRLKIRADSMAVQDKIFAVCSVCILLLCASGFTVMGISAARIFSYMLIMFISFNKGAPYGCAAGAALGAFLSASPGFGGLLPAMAVGGLTCGLCSRYGQSACAAACSLSAVITAAVQGKGDSIFIISAEALIAFGAFSLIPPVLMRKLRDFTVKRGFDKEGTADREVSRKLSVASENVYRVCDMISNLSADTKESEEAATDKEPYDGRLRELERVLTDQLVGIGDFLGELSASVNSKSVPDRAFAASLKTALKNAGVDVGEAVYLHGGDCGTTARITVEGRISERDLKNIGDVTELMTGCRFERPEASFSQAGTVITFRQKVPYRLQVGFSKKSAREGEPCGDSVSVATSVEGRGFVVISDGMGTGYQAAQDSSMAVKAMKRLLCSGFSFDSALKIMNSALIARSERESVVTVDGVEVNLFSGEVFFYKAGAACSIIRKRDRAVTLERSSMPLGIIRGIGFSKARFSGEAGDIILLLSDGVTQTDHGWINDELLSWSTNSMQELSAHILRLATLRRDTATADDMTVVAVKIERDDR